MRLGSLFSGIGALDLALTWAGFEPVWQVERDPWCRECLAMHWPDVPRYEDVTDVDFSSLPAVDVIAGGFPCQAASVAGHRAGGADRRWLWPDFARALDETKPLGVLVENVPGLLTAPGDIYADSYTGRRALARAGYHGVARGYDVPYVDDYAARPIRGGAFGSVLADLAALGYDARWQVLGASDVGAPHVRKRLWLVAAHPDRVAIRVEQQRQQRGTAEQRQAVAARHGATRAAAHPDRTRLRGLAALHAEAAAVASHDEAWHDADGLGMAGGSEAADAAGDGRAARTRRHAVAQIGRGVRHAARPTESPWADGVPFAPVRRVDDGASRTVDRHRLRGLGNAVVPQCALPFAVTLAQLITTHPSDWADVWENVG